MTGTTTRSTLVGALLEDKGVIDNLEEIVSVDGIDYFSIGPNDFAQGLGYPGGPAVERLAKEGDATKVPLPRPLLGSKEPHFSFAGLKSAVLRAKEAGIYADADIAASFQAAALDCVLDRLAFSWDRINKVPALVVAGGVAANAAIRVGLERFAAERAMRFVAPPPKLCTDNAAMIAWAGQERLGAGLGEPGGDQF